MLQRLHLRNFRCFENHTIEFPRQALIVGKNNAGKSTCVEGLRLISLVTERMKNLKFHSPPREFDLPIRNKGFRPSLESIFVHKECLFHRYSDPPALVSADFKNGARLDVHIGTEMLLHAVVFTPDGKPAVNRDAVEKARIPRVSILPQIAPLALEETKLNDAYVRSNIQTLRSSMHFRNQLRLFKDSLPDFQQRVSSTWLGIKIMSLDLPRAIDTDGRISLIVRDGDFSAEVAWMGHGLQMWIQMIWFLCRTNESSVLILDEPDVYMHADLQRKLVRMLMGDERQFIVATHSPEMLAEVGPESVVVLDRDKPISKSAASTITVQKLLQHVGSVHNISLARLGSYNRILLVEGKDIPLLKLFQNSLNANAPIPIDSLPNSDIGGWTKWPSVLTMAKFFRKNDISEIQIFCVLDRDYHEEMEIEERLRQAEKESVKLIVWEAKEIENYAIHPRTLARLISIVSDNVIDESTLSEVVRRLALELKESTIDDYSEAIRSRDKVGANKSNPLARNIVNERWSRLGGEKVVSGKKLFSKIAKWVQDEHKCSINLQRAIKEMRPDEVAPEVADFIANVIKCEGISS